jgi:mono/diheme cytochrome c family protein
MCSAQDRVLRISLLLSAATLFAHAETPLERGKYLVENASMCGDCHTPMLNGKPDASKQLKGSTLGFQPIGEVPGWHKTAPDISSTSQLFGRWGDDGFKKFLETGLNPRGHAADPPMPQYRFSPEDAAAILQYLKTVK